MHGPCAVVICAVLLPDDGRAGLTAAASGPPHTHTRTHTHTLAHNPLPVVPQKLCRPTPPVPCCAQPILFPAVTGEASVPLLRRYSFKANLWIAIFSFIGNWWCASAPKSYRPTAAGLLLLVYCGRSTAADLLLPAYPRYADLATLGF